MKSSKRGFREYYQAMPDGTLKQVNPFTGTEVWCVPGRGVRPLHAPHAADAAKINSAKKDRECPFCFKRLFETPPEKARLVKTRNGYALETYLAPEKLLKSRPLFRRIPNLFEIVTYSYWVKNYHYRMPRRIEEWKQRYLASPKGRGHVFRVLHDKLRMSGKSETEIERLTLGESLQMAEAFFAGSHELIVADPHFARTAKTCDEFFSTGDMTPEEHYQYMRFTLAAMRETYVNNPHVRYISVFQNWLKPAGASLDHLHKQLVGIDEWGVSINKEMALVRRKPNIYNDMAVNFAVEKGFVVAENEYAIAFAEFGHRYPTLAVYSKSAHCFPGTHSERELRGFSDLLHACHAALGRHLSCNEEWYYMPRDAGSPMPWHILIKWRTITSAGFEGGTRIYINPYSPEKVRDIILPALIELQNQGRLGNLTVGPAAPSSRNCLRYLDSKKRRR